MIGTSLFGQGAEFVLANVAKGLSERGHVVDVIVSGVHSETAKAHSGWQPFDIGVRANLVEMRSKRGRYSITEIWRLLRMGQYDVVICHSAPYAIPVVLATTMLRKRPKTVYVEHLGGVGLDDHGNEIARHQSLSTVLINGIMRFYDAQFAVSKGTLNAIHRMTGYPMSRLHLVYNPVLGVDFLRKRDLQPQHQWLKEPSCPVVVAAGALCKVKHYELLLEAFALVCKKKPAKLIIFGDGPLREKYEALAKFLGIWDDVSLPGFSNQLPAELTKASCFVVSSYVESFSIVLVEAMACGVPVVSVDAPYGPKEILGNGDYGILVENNNPQALADGIEKALHRRRMMPTQEFLRKYGVEYVAANYETHLKKICFNK